MLSISLSLSIYLSLSLSMYLYIYMHICIYIYIYVDKDVDVIDPETRKPVPWDGETIGEVVGRSAPTIKFLSKILYLSDLY